MNNILETERLILRMADIADADLVRSYLIENSDFLKEWEPARNDDYFSLSAIKGQIKDRMDQAASGTAIVYYLFLKPSSELIGIIAITNIIHGPFLSGFLGYQLSQKYINKGYMTEALARVIKAAFNEKGLHRIEANVMPRNIRSIRVLEKSGFTNEGMSRKYLKINGKWEDHIHYAILNQDMY